MKEISVSKTRLRLIGSKASKAQDAFRRGRMRSVERYLDDINYELYTMIYGSGGYFHTRHIDA